MNELERVALNQLLTRRAQAAPSEVVRYQDRLYVRYFVEFFVLENAEFVWFSGASPNPAIYSGVELVQLT